MGLGSSRFPPPQSSANTFSLIGFFSIIFVTLLFSIGSPFTDTIRNVPEADILAEYDYIIIGAGTSGCVLANRLSEDSTKTVLVLELGNQRSFLSLIPLLTPYLQLSNDDFRFVSEPQSQTASALRDRKLKLAAGKTVGGTSTINNMLYIRGNKRDFDGWAAAGNSGWGFDDVLPYYLKSEGNRNASFVGSEFHNSVGPLSVEDLNFKTPLAKEYLNAGQELGYPEVDLNGENQTGYAFPQGTTLDGKRFGTSRAFLFDASNRKNVHISLQSLVNKIIIDPGTLEATGVEFKRGTTAKTVKAKKEVLLAAGALQSPKILKLSGIGSSAELTKFNIPVIKNLKVGENLQDHVATGGLTYLITRRGSFVFSEILSDARKHITDFLFSNTGPLTSLYTIEQIGMINTKFALDSKDNPDISLVIASSSVNSDGGTQLRQIYNLRNDFYDAVFKPWENYNVYNVYPVLTRPKSRGTVTLKSSKPDDPPLIQPNYFTNPEDVKVMIEGIKEVFKFSNTWALYYSLWPSLINVFPACKDLELESDSFCECYARQFPVTFNDFVGTCKMGPAGDATAVVDNRLRVHGVKKLRVVDASIMPTIVTGPIYATNIMIAEKAADLIKEDNP